MAATGSSLDQQVRAYLDATLSPDEGTRRSAEEQLGQLYGLAEGGLSLTRILCDASGPLAQRQISITSAGVLLQKYITTHWYPGADIYIPPTTSAESKDQIRPLLLSALSDRERKVRTAAAFACSTVAKYDWPEDWPNLLSSLVQLLNSGNTDAVHGAMRVVLEFVKNELSEDQVVPVVRELVPALLSILGNTAHSFATRAETVAVYRHIITMLSTIKDEHPQAVRAALDSMAGVWFGAFNQLLAIDAATDVAASWESLALRIQIFRVLLSFQCSFPRYLAPHVATYIRVGILNLTSLLPTFNSYYISTDPDAPEPPMPAPDAAYTAKMDLDDLACSIFEFLEPTIRIPACKDMMVSGDRGSAIMETIVSLVLTYTQVTRQQEEEWLEDSNAFVEDEDEDNIVYSLRIVGYDLMGSMIDKFQRPVAQILNDFSKRRVPESAAASQTGQPDWWKPLESLLGLLGGLADDLTLLLDEDSDTGRAPSLDLHWFFDQVIPGLLGQSSALFLQGRAFVFASQFAGHLPPAIAEQYLNAAVHALGEPSTSVPVKISAVKTIRNFCRHVSSSIMGPQAGRVLTLLLPVLPAASDETLYLVMETVHAVVSLDKASLSGENTTAICEHVYAQWLKHSTDPVLTAIVEELVESLGASQSPPVVASLVAFFSPRLAELIATPTNEDTIHIPGEAVQLANAMIKPRGGPLEAEYISSVTIAVMQCLQQTDDMDVIQHGMIHLTLVVRKDCDKLVEWHDGQGHNGIARIFSLLGRFLAPTFSESGGMFVGDLIMHLFRKAGSAIAPVLGDLLQAVVNRLGTALLPSFIQSLVIPFAYLFGTEHTQQTIDLLTSFAPVTLADGSTTPALDLVLNSWCETAETITGSWNIRVNDLGLAKLFAFPNPALHGVMVRGDLIITDANRNKIMTRSRTLATPNEYTRVTFPVKALKLLLKDVQDGGKGKKGTAGADIADDDGDEEWDDDDPLGAANPADEFGFLSDWLDDGPGENDAQDDDEDLRADPLAQIDMGQHITDTLRSCYASNANGMHEMVDALTDAEKGTLRGVLTL